MKRTLFGCIVCYSICFSVFSQNGEIPQWFLNDMESNIGVWITDNDTYVSENEPYTQYGMEWRWGIGKTSIIGRLFGVVDGKETMKEDKWMQNAGAQGLLAVLYLVQSQTRGAAKVKGKKK